MTRQPRVTRVMSQMVRYGGVGLLGIALVTVAFAVLHTGLHLHYLVAGIIANEVGVCTNYVINNNWTFRDRRVRFLCVRGLARYHVVSLSGILIHLSTLFLLARVSGIAPILANLCAVTAAAGWSFIFNILWTWRVPAPVATPPARPAHAAIADSGVRAQ